MEVPSTMTDVLQWGGALQTLSVQSCFWTAQVVTGQEPDGSLSSSLLPVPQAEPDAVFTLLITGEGPADRRAITDSPQAWGWECYKHPPLSPKCDGDVQLSRGGLYWQNPRVQKRDIKDVRGIGRAGTDRGCAWNVEVELGASAKCHSKQSGV